MYIQDLFNPNQKKKLKGNKLVDNSKNLNSVIGLQKGETGQPPQSVGITIAII